MILCKELFILQLITMITIILSDITEAQQNVKAALLETSLIEDYCKTYKTCPECKKIPKCEWCHDYGCTGTPNSRCPRRFFQNFLLKNEQARYCTSIANTEPILLPANIRKFIKVVLKIDDLSLHDRVVICEIKVNAKILRIRATLVGNSAYCDMVVLKSRRALSLGSLRLLWGGVQPASNSISLIVYNCEYLAKSCEQCLALNKKYQCGWCKEVSSCTLVEQCPRQQGLWLNSTRKCYDNTAIKITLPHY